MPKLTHWLVTGFVFLLALIVSCGGDDKAATSDGASPSSDGSGTGTIQSVNLEKTASALTELQSFRFNLAVKLDVGEALATDPEDELGGAIAALLLGALADLRAEGAFVAPDRFEVTLSFWR